MGLQWTFLLLLTPLLAAQEEKELNPNISEETQEIGRCKAPSDWDPMLQFNPNQSSYAVNDLVQLSCAVNYVPSVPQIRCISNGTQPLWNRNATCKEGCQQPQLDSKIRFSPKKRFYGLNEEVTLSCLMVDSPPLAVIRCAKQTSPDWQNAWEVKDIQGSWHGVAENLSCTPGKCPKPLWDSRVQFPQNKKYYRLNEELTLTCPGDLEPSFPKVKCAREFLQVHSGEVVYGEAWWGQSSPGAWTIIERPVRCLGVCKKPWWDSDLQLEPNQEIYNNNEEVVLSCPADFQPSFKRIKCAREDQPNTNSNIASRFPWMGMDGRGAWVRIWSEVECIACERPQGDSRVRLIPDEENYKNSEEVVLSCPAGFQPSFTRIKCAKEDQPNNDSNLASIFPWIGMDSRGAWVRVRSKVECIGVCKKPWWDSDLQLEPNQENYKNNEEVVLSCPAGLQPSFTRIKCAREDQPNNNSNLVSRFPWMGMDSSGTWVRIRSKVECIEVLQVVPGTVEISSTSIKLNWTCRVPDVCQHMRATCRLAEPSSPPCKAEVLKGEEMLHGQEGTFTCLHLHPYTVYSVTISLPPDTILYTRLLRTDEAVPDKVEELWLDSSTGSLRWKGLPSCKGEIIGYQLNITTRSSQNGSFLEMERLWLSSSVTEHPLPEYSPDRSYVVTMQGLTAAGAGVASLWKFQTNSSDTPHPLGINCRIVHDVSPSQGTAVLPLQPIIRDPEGVREHQLIVAATHNSTAVEGACSGEPQSFNTSQQPSAYLAAVLNLTTPTGFVLGNGTHGQGYHNAALQPGWDYTALLRLVHRSQQTEKFTCVCYRFSLGQESGPLLGRRNVIIAAALVVVLLALGILLLLVLFRRKYSSSKTSENTSTIPLRRCRGGTCKLNTQIPVEELLEVMKKLKRAEIEAEQTEEETVDRHGAGRLREYQELSSTLSHPCDAGKELSNQSKNRYKSIIPYDHCRVVLQHSDTGNGYINASYVDSYRSPRFFIAAQGPLPGTVVDFWQMVWQEKTSIIVMLTGLVEQNKTKCERYWPEQEQVYGDFTVTLNNTRTTTGLVTRNFCLQKAGCALPRVVEQFHFLLWPDHGVPRNSAQLLCLVEVVNKRKMEASAGPVLVHCSAGIGRTGTFIALDFLLKMGNAEGKVDVFHCVQRLREQRVSMVQTKEQYTFLYEALLEGLLCSSTGVPVENIASHVRCLREAGASRQNNVLEKEFKALQNFSEFFQLLPCREAEKPSNQPKNRKPGILPADSCRPILMSSLNADGSPGYINAVFANMYTEEDKLIITQLPFPTTLVDFWALVWDYTCTSVVVLNQLQELDETYVEFWPSQGEADYGHFHVHFISEEPGAGFTAWTLTLTNSQQPKKSALEVRFWQLKDWPMQQHLPPNPDTIISLLGKVETHHRQSQDGHILVTCLDGASRSGIFCVASFLCEQIQSEGLVDVSQAVRMLKRRRRQLIKDVVNVDYKPSWEQNQNKSHTLDIPAAALTPLCSDHPRPNRAR
ncbi:receptor-type tyrosine-protein phosphatase kappa isoform X2 [Cuculus canorus]|uniref:receptor-type tyrosine-protein phosphatase kappa isoform X2 n=1 Tax=Cuculus canorus TaxID=55661 RepID=UPI0023AAB4A9|nr:receptor-type tyrosine-protein phosphatase kappa isoform X2 [Cuculus canorus]